MSALAQLQCLLAWYPFGRVLLLELKIQSPALWEGPVKSHCGGFLSLLAVTNICMHWSLLVETILSTFVWLLPCSLFMCAGTMT